MDLIQALVLGVVQGATEFLPISSSGHLVLVPWLLGWPAPGLAFDALVHWGTLTAVLTYFSDDLLDLARGWVSSLRERSLNPEPQRRLSWLLLAATVPIGLAGLLFEGFFSSLFARPLWTAAFLLFTGLILVVGEWLGRRRSQDAAGALDNWQSLGPLTLIGALIIGTAQALAIAPGISRSGATIAAGLGVGLGRRDAARFSFWLATPAIVGAGLLQLVRLVQAGGAATASQAPTLFVGFVAAAVTGYLAIRFLLTYLQRNTLTAFAAYCWFFGLLSLLVVITR